MPHFRLCYRDSSQRFNVTVVETRSLMHARLRAVLAAENEGMIYTEGHELNADMAPLVRPGRVLSADEAMELFSQLEPIPASRPAAGTKRFALAAATGARPPKVNSS